MAASRIVVGKQSAPAGGFALAALAGGALSLTLALAAWHGGIDSALTEGALYLLPALLLGLALVAGRRPAERLIVALHRRFARRAGRTGSAVTPNFFPTRPAEQIFPRGGRLIAAALAGRAPPPAWAVTHSS